MNFLSLKTYGKHQAKKSLWADTKCADLDQRAHVQSIIQTFLSIQSVAANDSIKWEVKTLIRLCRCAGRAADCADAQSYLEFAVHVWLETGFHIAWLIYSENLLKIILLWLNKRKFE